jgi:hypothetical protein
VGAALAVRVKAWTKPLPCLAAGVLLGLCATHIHQRGEAGDLSREQVGLLHGLAAQWLKEAQSLRRQLNSADGEIAIERGARVELEDQLRASTVVVGQLQDRLDFYEQLLPAGPAGIVTLRGVRVQRAPQGLRYQVLLTRSARPHASSFQGMLQFIANGVSDGQPRTIELAPPTTMSAAGGGPTRGQADAASSASSQLQLNFDRYQRNEGILTLPQGFIPTDVMVNVVQEGVVRASQITYSPF